MVRKPAAYRQKAPETQAMPHQQPVIEVTAADGHRFELIHVQARQPRASVLFMPGMGLSARQYIAFAQALASHDIECYLHEWRGLGSSSLRASRAVDWGYRELIDLDLAAALDALPEACLKRPLVFAGHSLGSQIACLLAARQSARCQGIAIIAGGSPWWRSFPLPMGLALRLGLSMMPLVASALGHYPGRRLGFAGREARSLMADWARSGRTGVYRPYGFDQDLEQALSRLELPVLGLRLADDWFVPDASLAWLTGKLASATVIHATIAADEPGHKADHYSWMKAPATSARAIADWLQSTAAIRRA